MYEILTIKKYLLNIMCMYVNKQGRRMVIETDRNMLFLLN